VHALRTAVRHIALHHMTFHHESRCVTLSYVTHYVTSRCRALAPHGSASSGRVARRDTRVRFVPNR
jgi:hypothetical protein